MYRFLPVLVVAVAAAQTPAPKPAVPAPAVPAPAPATPAIAADQVILSIGDEKITKAQFEQFIEALPEQYRAMARGPAKRQIAEQLCSIKSLAQEARRRKLDQTPSFQQQLAFQGENLLAGILYQDISTNSKVEDADARKYFDDHRKDYEQATGKHILIRYKGSPVPLKQGATELTEAEALEKAEGIRKRLLAGEDFAALAKTESDDAGSAISGGSLGTFKRGTMVGPFDQAAFTLPLKQLSEPVKTQFGYHVIFIEQRDVKTFDEVKAEIEKKTRPEIAKRTVEDLRKKANVSISDAYFGPEQAAPPRPQ
jgi:parvulin-like peptidyl-prolyl isomerase